MAQATLEQQLLARLVLRNNADRRLDCTSVSGNVHVSFKGVLKGSHLDTHDACSSAEGATSFKACSTRPLGQYKSALHTTGISAVQGQFTKVRGDLKLKVDAWMNLSLSVCLSVKALMIFRGF